MPTAAPQKPDIAKTQPQPRGKAMGAIGSALHCLFWPNSWRRAAVFVACWGILQPLGAAFFPRAEKVAAQEGLNPAVVEMLAPGKTIYVREGENPYAKAHAVADMPWIMMPFHYRNTMSETSPVAAYTLAQPGGTFLSTPLRLLPESMQFCTVYMKPKSTFEEPRDVRAAAEKHTGKIKWKNAAPAIATRDEMYQLALLHEIRHCSDENQRLPVGYAQEADATWKAAEAMATVKKNPGLTTVFKYSTSITLGGNYDHALYIDAMQKGRKPPTEAEVQAAAREVQPYLYPLMMRSVARAMGMCDGRPDAPAACSLVTPKFNAALAVQRYKLTEAAFDELLATAPSQNPAHKKTAPAQS